MTEGQGAWFPVALGDDIEPGTSNGTRLFAREIVVWRGMDGGAHVWEDRCPHRGMRLSLGFVRGDHIACLYHGWRYDGSGHCRFIPAHPQLAPPETIRVGVIESFERLGMIWARVGVSETPPPDDGPVVPVRSITIDCAAEAALSLLSGPGPDHFVPTSRPTGSDTAALLSVSLGDDRLHIGVQPLSAEACVLHIVIAGDRGDHTSRRRASAWAEDIRSRLEQHADGGGATA